jgi:hypothetical protein
VVVLRFLSGQEEDIITKDLIEMVPEGSRCQLSEVIANTVSEEYQRAQIFFL